MVYHTQSMELSEIQLISENESGRVVVCEDLASAERTNYTVYVTSDHEIIARMHRAYNDAKNLSPETTLSYDSDGGMYLIIYPYVPSRPLLRFYMGKSMPVDQCEEVIKNYIVMCLTAELPWSVLYLAVTQEQVDIARDGSVYLSYAMDLSEVNEEITEKDCVGAVVTDLLTMMAQKEDNVRWDLRTLLEMRSKRAHFYRFTDLYRDVEIASNKKRKAGFFRRLALWFSENKDRLFRILLTISIILVVFTIVTFLTNALFGDVPWLRFFIRSFERIGTESLVQ